MSFCCENPLFLGCFNSCDGISLGIDADVTGSYVIEYEFLGNVQSVSFAGVSGNPILLPSIFNEFAISNFRVLDPNGTPLDIDGSTCFKAKINTTFI